MFGAAPIVVRLDIEAPLHRVWTAAADFATHAEWMLDVRSLEFLTEQRRGVGTRMRVRTVVGPFATTDELAVTEWQEGRMIGVEHRGAVSGTGSFALAPLAGATRFTWTEDLHFPAAVGGQFTALVARPVLAAVWAAGLRRLRDRLAAGDAET